MNYILKAAVIALQIDSVNGNTVYFINGSTLAVDNEFITNQVPGSGDYVIDGVKVMERGKFEAMYCKDVPVDEGEVIAGLREELHTATEACELLELEKEELTARLADYEPEPPVVSEAEATAGGESSGVSPQVDPGDDNADPATDPAAPESVAPLGEGVDAEGSGTPDGTAAGDDPALS